MKTYKWFLRGSVLALGLTGAAALLISQNGATSPSGAATLVLAEVPASDPILHAMHDEMERSRQLRIAGAGDVPYYLSYSVTDADNIAISSSLGAIYNVSRNHFRSPATEVRVGSYDFDNTGHVFSGIYTGSRYDTSWPLDDDYLNLRQALWLSTDVAYKAALESMARKR